MRALTTMYAAGRRLGVPRRDPVATVRDIAGPAAARGIDPHSPGAGAIVAAVLTECPGPGLLDYLTAANDPRRERYFDLLSVINGWPAGESAAPALDWFIKAMAAVANRTESAYPSKLTS
jgi:hypothetical protein